MYYKRAHTSWILEVSFPLNSRCTENWFLEHFFTWLWSSCFLNTLLRIGQWCVDGALWTRQMWLMRPALLNVVLLQLGCWHWNEELLFWTSKVFCLNRFSCEVLSSRCQQSSVFQLWVFWVVPWEMETMHTHTLNHARTHTHFSLVHLSITRWVH